MENKDFSTNWYDRYFGEFDNYDSFLRQKYKSTYYDSESNYYRNSRRSSLSSLISSSFSNLKDDFESEDDRRSSIFEKALKLTREFISILNFPYKIKIIISDSISELVNNSLDYRLLFLPTKVLDHIENKEDEDLVNMVVSYGLHEAAHLKYTSEIKYTSIVSRTSSNLIKLFIDILEDERVDRLLEIDRPGYSSFLQSNRKNILGDLNKKTIIGCNPSVDKILYNLILMIRCPQEVDKGIVNKFELLFNDFNNILNSFPNNMEDVLNIATKLSDRLEHYLKSLGISFEEDLNSSINVIKNLIVPYLYTHNKDIEKLPKQFISNILKSSKYSDRFSGFICNIKQSLGIFEKFENDIYFSHEIKENKKAYLDIQNKILPFIPSIRNKIITSDKNMEYLIHGCRSGELDTTKLVEAYQSVPQVYKRSTKITTNKVVVCVLVDESGSMFYDKKLTIAREAAILLYEVVKPIPGVDLYIYGHTADDISINSTDIRVYVEPGLDNHLSLPNISARRENRDGNAILSCAKRIRKKTSDKCLMFVLSDGCPCANKYFGDKANLDTAEKVKKAENLGFDIIQVTIEGKISDTKSMFSKYIDLRDDLSTLPEKLGRIIRDHIIKNKVSTIG